MAAKKKPAAKKPAAKKPAAKKPAAKKPAAKKPTAKKPAAKKPTAKKKAAVKGKRYTDAEKAEVLAFVKSQGRGGQSKAVVKFGVSALTISNWRKKAGGAGKATKAAIPSEKGGDTWSAMVALKKDIGIMESKLAAKKAEFSKLAGQL